MSLFNETSPKKRLLALHGRGSNSDVTKMQVENLGFDEQGYEVVCINGPVSTDGPSEDIAEISQQGMVSAPWFSWLSDEDEIEGYDFYETVGGAVNTVLREIESTGPYDCIYGFSQGGVIAALINGLVPGSALYDSLKSYIDPELLYLLEDLPIKAAIYACAAAPLSTDQLWEKLGLDHTKTQPVTGTALHLIGRHDRHKSWSEAFAISLKASPTELIYLNESHEISRNQRADKRVINFLEDLFNSRLENDEPSPAWLQTSRLSTRCIASETQLSAVKIDTTALPLTIKDLLSNQPENAPLFRLAREKDAQKVTSYGEMLAFIQPHGQGDLRRLGVKEGEIVAYVAPLGGSAVAAAAFITIASQTCAVPISANINESDALSAFKQYRIDHLIIFEGVNSLAVESAFETYTLDHKAAIHRAIIPEGLSPGLFQFGSQQNQFIHLPVLNNSPEENALLLRTSGTTSLPKVVPLRHKDLVLNAAFLADSIGIDASDVTYSIMPLDHIGGLSASILCSLSVGASITCDGLYNPQAMLEALAISNPRPTWYSAVPTIHNATVRYLLDHADSYLAEDKQWHAHNLRMVRSGAAALKESDRAALESTLGCEVATTYSMSEMMPICQPPLTESGWQQKPGAVGVPLLASLAIVDPVTLKPQPFGTEGEIALSGETVFAGYLDNPEANAKSRFLMYNRLDNQLTSWFLTGDLGLMDQDGTLQIKGRIKELIKKGGEQIAPSEVENLLCQHPLVNIAVCFSVPSDIYGEEVGCALVLKKGANENAVISELRTLLRENKLASYKYPSHWKQVTEEELPRTASKKLIRNGLADVLGINSETDVKPEAATTTEPGTSNQSGGGDFYAVPATGPVDLSKPNIDWATLAGFRFLLACYVMFMHIGSDASWDAFSNLRQFPWHVHAFFTLAGFSLAAVMPALIKKKVSFISARVSGMYPLYALALVFALGNLLVGCQPSTFSSVFHWGGQLAGSDQMFCQGTPWVQDSWLANVFLTLGIHITGLQATPLWGASWFMGFYLWFISMYFQCLVVFPYLYNALYKNRGNTKRLFMLTLAGLAVNLLIVLAFWYGYAVDATGYGFYDALTGERAIPSAEQLDMAAKDNAVILGFYLFAPFWMVYFVAGMCAAFLFDAMRPNEQKKAYLWGYVADGITVFMVCVSIAHVAQGYFPHGADLLQVSLEPFFMRPEAADTFADPATVNRIWDNIYGRLFAPVTLLWIFALSTGQGLTARVLRMNPISQVLAPTAYACFLFHQMIGQWYFAITRNGEWWNWWGDQKAYYWFSPQPVAVEWYEFFYVVGLVVLFAKVIQPLDPLLRKGFKKCLDVVKGTDSIANHRNTKQTVLALVQRTTGMDVKAEWSLEQCGLASLGIVQFTNALETEFSTSGRKINLSVSEIMEAKSIEVIAEIIDHALAESVSGSTESSGPVLQTS